MINPRLLLIHLLGILLALLPLGVMAEDAPQADASYILRPNDSIRLAVYLEPDLSGSVRILKTGQASFPLIGTVHVGGLTVSAAETMIHGLYAADYLVDPKLTLTG